MAYNKSYYQRQKAKKQATALPDPTSMDDPQPPTETSKQHLVTALTVIKDKDNLYRFVKLTISSDLTEIVDTTKAEPSFFNEAIESLKFAVVDTWLK